MQYFVKVGFFDEFGQSHHLGELTVQSDSTKEACRKGVEEHYDPRLDCASCSPWAEASPV